MKGAMKDIVDRILEKSFPHLKAYESVNKWKLFKRDVEEGIKGMYSVQKDLLIRGGYSIYNMNNRAVIDFLLTNLHNFTYSPPKGRGNAREQLISKNPMSHLTFDKLRFDKEYYHEIVGGKNVNDGYYLRRLSMDNWIKNDREIVSNSQLESAIKVSPVNKISNQVFKFLSTNMKNWGALKGIK